MIRLALLMLVLLLNPSPGFPQTASDSNIAAKLTGHLVPHDQVGRAVRHVTPPPCDGGGGNLTTAGTEGVLYDLLIFLQDVTVSSPPDGIAFYIDYEPASGDRGLEIVAWESFVGAQVQHPNAAGDDWPAPGSGISLVLGEETAITPHAEEAQDRGGLTLGRLLIMAHGEAVFRFSTASSGTEAGSTDQTPVVVHDASGTQSLASPDHLGEVAFGVGKIGYDPCQAAVTLETGTAEVQLGAEAPLAVTIPRNPSASRVEWTVTSSQSRAAKVTLYSVSGRRVRHWESVTLAPGRTKLVWDGLDQVGARAPSGVYYLEVASADGYRVVTKAVLVRE